MELKEWLFLMFKRIPRQWIFVDVVIKELFSAKDGANLLKKRALEKTIPSPFMCWGPKEEEE